MYPLLLVVNPRKHCYSTMIQDSLHILTRQDYYEYTQSFDQLSLDSSIQSDDLSFAKMNMFYSAFEI
jgi:hypothetical protein